jgi:hypothetical protein
VQRLLLIFILFFGLQTEEISAVQAQSLFTNMYPYYAQDVVPIPLEQPWGYVSLIVEDRVAHFEVGIYESILGYFKPGFEPEVEFFWFNYTHNIQLGDISFDSSLNWVTNPVDTVAGDRGPFDYQVFVGRGFGERVLKFQVRNLPEGVTESAFSRPVMFQGGFTKFRISMNEIAALPNGGVSGMHLVDHAPNLQPNTVELDIRPGSDPNSINPSSRGVIPIAILTTDTFEATSIDPLSVEFGPNGATEAHNRGHIEDVDGDGDDDLVLHFKTQETGIQCGDIEASLTGQTVDGTPIVGADSITTRGCE